MEYLGKVDSVDDPCIRLFAARADIRAAQLTAFLHPTRKLTPVELMALLDVPEAKRRAVA